jgi:stage II sporulation protein AA (anti-sigma F factor antagonist)
VSLTIAERGVNLVINIIGDIDQHNTEELRVKIDRAFERSHCRHIIFDFSSVSFMDSSGIGLLIGRYKTASAKGGAVAIAGMTNELKRIYNISGLKKIIKSFDTLDDAENLMTSKLRA